MQEFFGLPPSEGGLNGLDRAMPHIGVIMEKTNTRDYPGYALPEGYVFVRYWPGLEKQWAALHYEVGQFNSLEEAETTFERDFAGREALAERMLFVLDEHNELAGTGALWEGHHFGTPLQRLHWIAVSPKHQGRGIAKAIVSKLLDIYNALGLGDYIYLTSQTWSWRALCLYMGFGFRPYMGAKPVNWRAERFEEKTIEAWNMIYGKLSARLRLPPAFYAKDVLTAAPALLGKLLCRRLPDGTVLRRRITETEAYRGEDDTACHARAGKTRRTAVMFGPGGFSYVYLCYGIHSLLNIVTGADGQPQAALIRGVEGLPGPGRVTKAMAIDCSLNGLDLRDSDLLWVEDDGLVCPSIVTGPRVGIGYASEEDQARAWRFTAGAG